jgi:hypothetical protein
VARGEEAPYGQVPPNAGTEFTGHAGDAESVAVRSMVPEKLIGHRPHQMISALRRRSGRRVLAIERHAKRVADAIGKEKAVERTLEGLS